MEKKTLYLISVLTFFCFNTILAQNYIPFVSKEFSIPEILENDYFRLRMLTVNDVVKDYDAVISSSEELQKMFPTWSGWPKGLTFEQDLIDLGWHQGEFQMRGSFTYTVASLDEKQILGCVYILPFHKSDFDIGSPKKNIGNFDAVVYLWVRTSVLKDGMDEILYKTVSDWITNKWPFKKVAYPGREITWADWRLLKNE